MSRRVREYEIERFDQRRSRRREALRRRSKRTGEEVVENVDRGRLAAYCISDEIWYTSTMNIQQIVCVFPIIFYFVLFFLCMLFLSLFMIK
jgi:hypothetical protein